MIEPERASELLLEQQKDVEKHLSDLLKYSASLSPTDGPIAYFNGWRDCLNWVKRRTIEHE